MTHEGAPNPPVSEWRVLPGTVALIVFFVVVGSPVLLNNKFMDGRVVDGVAHDSVSGIKNICVHDLPVEPNLHYSFVKRYQGVSVYLSRQFLECDRPRLSRSKNYGRPDIDVAVGLTTNPKLQAVGNSRRPRGATILNSQDYASIVGKRCGWVELDGINVHVSQLSQVQCFLGKFCALGGSSRRFFGSFQPFSHVVTLKQHRDELDNRAHSEHSSKNRNPIGRRWFTVLIVGAWACLSGIRGLKYIEANRRFCGWGLVGSGIAAFGSSVFLLFLSGFSWSWGWWL
jgi:hypothetical protein